MQAISQVQRDISYQECTINGQPSSIFAENSSCPATSTVQNYVPAPGASTFPSNHHNMTTYQPVLAQTTPPGKSKWKGTVKQNVQQQYNFPLQQPAPPLPTPQMFFNTYTSNNPFPEHRGQLLPHCEPFCYPSQHQHYYSGNFPTHNVYPNGYRPQILSPTPRPYLTITQFNYQPSGYHHHAHPQPVTSTNLVFGPPPRDRRPGNESPCRIERVLDQPKMYFPNIVACGVPFTEDGRNCKKSDAKSDSSGSFEFTIQPEQIVNSLCDEKEQETMQCRSQLHVCKGDDASVVNSYGSPPKMWTEYEFTDPNRIEDDDLTKFIVEGCLKAEAIAVHNQHRPCFKNIKHLCTRTRTDILKPRTTVANIHSQGIPWATKDFIFAFVRLINSWYILKGYLDDHEGSLGKIENALIPEFKECYQRWQSNNKEMVKHLINIFVNLDNGVTVQNAEIYSSFNSTLNKNLQTSSDLSPNENLQNDNRPVEVNPCPCPCPFSQKELNSQNKKLGTNNPCNEPNKCDESGRCCNHSGSCHGNDLKYSNVNDVRMTGHSFAHIKEEIISPVNSNEDTESDRECHYFKIYMKPGSYRVPKKKYASHNSTSLEYREKSSVAEQAEPTLDSLDSTEMNTFTKNVSDSHLSDSPSTSDDIWKSALESIGPFMKSVLKDSDSSDLPSNDLHCPKKSCHSNDSSEKESENSDNKQGKKTFINTKDTLTWINEHNFENYLVDDNTEEASDLPKGTKNDKEELPQTCHTRKNLIYTRTYKKKNDDVDAVNKTSSKQCDGSVKQEKSVSKKNESIQTMTSMYFLSRRRPSLSSATVSKFEKIINALWNLQFARYITFEVNAENVPDYFKYICKPMFLYKIMNNLKQNKYNHPYQVVHHLRVIVHNSELYVKKRPDWWFEKCMLDFSEELETQLAEKFPSMDFSSVTGDPFQPPKFELNTGANNEPQN